MELGWWAIVTGGQAPSQGKDLEVGSPLHTWWEGRGADLCVCVLGRMPQEGCKGKAGMSANRVRIPPTVQSLPGHWHRRTGHSVALLLMHGEASSQTLSCSWRIGFHSDALSLRCSLGAQGQA